MLPAGLTASTPGPFGHPSLECLLCPAEHDQHPVWLQLHWHLPFIDCEGGVGCWGMGLALPLELLLEGEPRGTRWVLGLVGHCERLGEGSGGRAQHCLSTW